MTGSHGQLATREETWGEMKNIVIENLTAKTQRQADQSLFPSFDSISRKSNSIK